MKKRFDVGEDNAAQEVVVENIYKGVEFRGTNLWVLICGTFIAALGLNINSTPVVIGAMLISPLMGPIIGIGLSLGINDFELMKKSMRNFLWMVIVAIITSIVYFVISPSSNAQSELLARTSPTTYDVLIAFVGGITGMLAQTRRDRTSIVIAGVAIATTLLPPLCTVGYGVATMQPKFIFGAMYLFLINTVFIAISAYMMVVFLKYGKKTEIESASARRYRRLMWTFAVIVIVPSMFLTVNILRKTNFENNADKFVASEFQFSETMIVDYTARYHYDNNMSCIEIKLIGEPLTQNVINNARAQLEAYGLTNTDLIIRQVDNSERIDFSTLQRSYAEIIDEKNSTIAGLRAQLASLRVAETVATDDISREVVFVTDNIGSMSLAKHVVYDTSGTPLDTVLVCVIEPQTPSVSIDKARVAEWLSARTGSRNIQVIIGE